MRTSFLVAPMYVAMIGVPVLMVIYVISYVFAPLIGYYLLLPLIALGLLIFGITGFFEVYAKVPDRQPKPANITDSDSSFEDVNLGEKHQTQISLTVTRFNVGTKKLEKQTYKSSASKFTTVLDMLLHAKSKGDQTLSFRYSCRMGICGSCGMVVNGKPMLACEANAINNAIDGKIEVGPMEAHPLIKDLVTDFDEFFNKHISIKPWLHREDKKEQYVAQHEYQQSQQEIEKFLPYSYCIMCGLCMDACPVVNTNKDFIGPQPLSQAYRYYKDSRDQLDGKRIESIDTLDGIWGCEFAGACSKVCPKGVDPASAIQLLKNEAIKRDLKKE